MAITLHLPPLPLPLNLNLILHLHFIQLQSKQQSRLSVFTSLHFMKLIAMN